MIIGIDIDDTITDTSIVANKYLTLFSRNYQDYHELPQEKYYDFLNEYQAEIVKNNILKEGCQEAFKYLKENGWKIIIITARSSEFDSRIEKLTKEFLANNNLIYDKIIFNAIEKGTIASSEHLSIFIDDKEEVLDDVNKFNITCLRFTQKASKYKTFNNWYDIIEYIKKIRKE